ncbi:MAG TPA: methylenetetrahydrofolate reductase [Kribbella sp.]|nr:methylenetetrahydrofolate reductase [Kribbella sp.]
MRGFELVCEVEPPTRPDLKKVRHQIGVMSPIANAFLIPDNHIGRATVSSVAVANEVQAMGSRGIACLNSRDRNLLGFKRDLLTAAAYGVEQFLFVHGDDPAEGARTSQLTVRTMIEHARGTSYPDCNPFQVGAATRLRPVPRWKAEADFLYVQVSYDLDELLRWRDSVVLDIPVYAGVMVLASAKMAHNLAGLRQLCIPAALIEAVERDRDAGVDHACDQILKIRDSGAFDGVHLIPVSRYRQVAARLEREL